MTEFDNIIYNGMINMIIACYDDNRCIALRYRSVHDRDHNRGVQYNIIQIISMLCRSGTQTVACAPLVDSRPV